MWPQGGGADNHAPHNGGLEQDYNRMNNGVLYPLSTHLDGDSGDWSAAAAVTVVVAYSVHLHNRHWHYPTVALVVAAVDIRLVPVDSYCSRPSTTRY